MTENKPYLEYLVDRAKEFPYIVTTMTRDELEELVLFLYGRNKDLERANESLSSDLDLLRERYNDIYAHHMKEYYGSH